MASGQPNASSIYFGPFRLDSHQGRLYRLDRPVRIRPKALSVLQVLATQPHVLVTHDELLAGVWSEVTVTRATLIGCISDLRHALRDPAADPRYIEAAAGRGYRFIGTPAAADTIPTEAETNVVGRTQEWSQFNRQWSMACAGRRQFLLIKGGPGIGKTALVDEFARVSTKSGAAVARGQCMSLSGEGEAYLPLLGALDGLLRTDRITTAQLKRHAAEWAEMLRPGGEESMTPRIVTSRGSTLHAQACRVLEAIALEAPTLLLLEDLHWSDHATIDFLETLSRRRETARLMVIVTMRTATEGLAAEFAKEATANALCTSLELPQLDDAAIRVYLDRRFPDGTDSSKLADWLLTRTSGTPLFLIRMVDHLIDQGLLDEQAGLGVRDADLLSKSAGIPSDLHSLIKSQLIRLSEPEARAIQAAAVAGEEFTALEVAAGLGIDIDEAEPLCTSLVDRNQIVPAGAERYPDKTIASKYRFVHSLHRDVVLDGLPPALRIRLHLALAQALVEAHQHNRAQAAGLLAVHFEEAGELESAIEHRALAAQEANRRQAAREAAIHANRGLQLIETLGKPGMARLELSLYTQLTPAVASLQGEGLLLSQTVPLGNHASDGEAFFSAERNYERMLELCDALGDDGPRVAALWARAWGAGMRGDVPRSIQLSKELLGQAEMVEDSRFVVAGEHTLANAAYYAGNYEESYASAQRALDAFNPSEHGALVEDLGIDVPTNCTALIAMLDWHNLEPTRATQGAQEAIECARRVEHPYSITAAYGFAAVVEYLCDALEGGPAFGRSALKLANEHKFPMWQGVGRILTATDLEEPNLVADETLAALEVIESSSRLGNSFFRFIAGKRMVEVGRFDDARAIITHALEESEQSGEVNCLPGFHVLRGWVAPNDEAREDAWKVAFERSREKTSYRAVQIEVAVSLASLWQAWGRIDEAESVLASVLTDIPTSPQTQTTEAAVRLLAQLRSD
ncbi:MAG: AAA family ATPase [Myxococcota bacterium]